MSELGAFLADFLRDPAFLSRYPYYAAVLSRMAVVADPSMQRMGVSLQNGRVFLHVNVASFQEEPQYLRGVLLHEVHHVVLGHLGNPKFADADQPDLMDLALEMSANEYIEEPLPDPITWKQYAPIGIRAGQSTIERYHRLCEARRGNTSKPVPGETSRVDDHRPMNAPGRDPGTVEATRQLLRSAFEEAERLQPGPDASPKSRLVAGKDPGHWLQDLVGHAPPPERPFDWKTAIRMFAARTRAPVHTYARPNRRFPDRVGEIPGRTYSPRVIERPTLLVAIDTSTSMTDRELTEVARELTVLTEHARLTIVECDVEITRVYAFEGRVDKVAGRGGTDLRPVFDEAFLASHRTDGVIYFTDGIGPLPASAPRLPVLWVLTKPGEFACQWGQTVRLHK